MAHFAVEGGLGRLLPRGISEQVPAVVAAASASWMTGVSTPVLNSWATSNKPYRARKLAQWVKELLLC